MKNIALILLILIALVMILLGYQNQMLPPALTGIGFILIAYLLWSDKTKV
ncbi:Uncharacterised protein [Candidatus Ornithobacterium hominis]|uniref:Uncharacterized protein n=1 Tax=Candidatus Ornithobacterium hominis TaxID=2497989 RepID=A0A383U0I7_9FLAO|nr:hypothetical protein [Candidatus Ornithobacterium hominis]MCT7904294.1 hypothetical protein [Candidatus Ornithobacterium hominis]CAI9429489.1 DUF3290 domain-containing protein [Candidatus Ornithobacterium hominis]SZD72959.1 Uncharacterised protein [Candidatus Ornithobacterium hominis]SZD73164.1 Uncharacterised protein [Candidatus Ornithobacterium hominis]